MRAAIDKLQRSLTGRVVDDFDCASLSGRARTKRWRVFEETFPELERMNVLDLGGDARAWRLSPVRPAHVILLNVRSQEVAERWMTSVVGDACDPPPISAVDLIYSNSVIGHVGGHWRRQRFAETVRSADRYWVQTPNRYFPLEPSFMFPCLQHLPRRLQRELIARWPLGNFATVVDRREVLSALLEIELLSRTELRFYFPDAEIYDEKVLGMTKSFVAIRR